MMSTLSCVPLRTCLVTMLLTGLAYLQTVTGLAHVVAVLPANIEGRELGVFGDLRINVLRVNLALACALGRPERADGGSR